MGSHVEAKKVGLAREKSLRRRKGKKDSCCRKEKLAKSRCHDQYFTHTLYRSRPKSRVFPWVEVNQKKADAIDQERS